ncbi:DUF2637 domain-containing protein [Streptomyces sp. LP05-1]|uniref:DUF2637 domain-containing protein n=1 Tax=Streptomyces pyxinae TaxID=2970734 RepID=A0ABT2CKX5_9ACTN|nr:DUF2637 domain-containing protein [Streptomyces sp. LP05-1]MCS0638073.1 DUF2637 domain-containing protein [Streptomyces sp. LP05-1]
MNTVVQFPPQQSATGRHRLVPQEPEDPWEEYGSGVRLVPDEETVRAPRHAETFGPGDGGVEWPPGTGPEWTLEPEDAVEPDPEPESRPEPVSARPARRSLRWLAAAVPVFLTTLIVIAVEILGVMASYPSLRALAAEAATPRIATLWPLLVYGPWIAASLSIVRARLFFRRTRYAWFVAVVFAGVAVLLCVLNAPATPAGITVAALPPIAVLLCFQQLVRQFDLSGPVERNGARRHARGHRAPYRPQRPSGR